MDALKTLIVDDEHGMRHSITRALRSFRVMLPDVEGETGFELDQAASVAEALQKIKTAPPDILLLDYKLDDGTGLDVLEQIEAADGRIATVMVTAYATLETAIRATKQGAHDFLAKPFTPTELKDVVRRTAEHLIVERRARELAAEKRRVRFEFIRVLGHELKAPLAAVEGFLHLLEQRCCGEKIEDYDEIVRRCLSRTEGMRKLIVDLLDLTRIEAGERQRTVETVDLVPLVESSIETMRVLAADRHIEIDLDAPGSLHMQGDRVELEIVLNNLISNAVKYNRDGGSVSVRLQQDGDWAVLAVEDNGIGMTPEDCQKLFNDFVRIRNDKTRLITGSGLGLSTVKKIAQIYEGDVGVTSTPDLGSTFTVRFKRQPAPQEEADAPPRSDSLAQNPA